MGYRVVEERSGCTVADRLLFGQHRDTQVVWSVPDDVDGAEYEPQLRPDIRRTLPNYPEARACVLTQSRAGFSRDFTEELRDRRIKLLVPVQFFDTPFKTEESSEATRSAISELRSQQQRVPQPFVEGTHCGDDGRQDDLFGPLFEQLRRRQKSSSIYIVVGEAGIGKSVLFQALFSRLYDDFLSAKNAQRLLPRPIPLVPEHIRQLPALRTELLLDSFLQTDVVSPVGREAFEWLLVNGFATWLLDGLDELYASDPNFFYAILDLVIRKDSKAQILLTCRDSLLSDPDAFRDLEEWKSGDEILHIYRLRSWEARSKRHYAWIQEESRLPRSDEQDTPSIRTFLGQVTQSETLKSLSGLPFYCKILFDLFHSGELREFTSDVELMNYVIERMIDREVKKEVLQLDVFQQNGLQDWLEQIAAVYVESSCTRIHRTDAEEYAGLVLVDAIDAEMQQRIVTNLLQFPLFSAGSEQGLVSFAHELLSLLLAAQWCRSRLSAAPGDIGIWLHKRPDSERATLTRFIAYELSEQDEKAVRDALRSGSAPESAFAPLLSVLMKARPGRDLLKQLGVNMESKNMKGIRFQGRDLSGLSFRSCDLTLAAFQDCDLKDAHFQGALLHRTNFNDVNLANAEFGDAGRIQSVVVGGKLLESMEKIKEWLTRDAARVEVIQDPCPAALQLRHLFGKFVDRLGNPKRDQLGERGLIAGKRYSGAATTEQCMQAAVSHGYLIGPDFRQRYRRAEGDRYAEMVQFVRDGRVSDSLGQVIARLCHRQACLHRVQ
jgi:hypothetical protein